MKKLFLFTFLTFFVFSPLANAEIQTYDGVGEYIMSDFETPDIAKQRAKARAEQSAVEQAGVFVKSYTRTVNSVVAEDEIIAIANTIIKITKVDYTTTPVNDSGGSFRIVATIKADVDSARIDEWLKRGAQENAELVEQNKRLQQEKVKQDAEIAELRKKLANVASEQEKKNLEKDVVSADRKFLADQKIEEGWRLYSEKNYVEAVATFSQAIGLDENNAYAYYGRAIAYAYNSFNNRVQAIADMKKVIEINPKIGDMPYFFLGLWYRSQNNYKAAIDIYTNAIERYPMKDSFYSDRAKAYIEIGDYQSSLNDYNHLINIHKTSSSYEERAELYIKVKKYDLALRDFDSAVKIAPNNYYTLIKRGCLYSKVGNYNLSIVDLTRSIDFLLKEYNSPSISDNYKRALIKDKLLEAYTLRGCVYYRFKNTESAVNDFKMALSLTENGKLEGYAYYLMLGRGESVGLSKSEYDICFYILKNGIKQ